MLPGGTTSIIKKADFNEIWGNDIYPLIVEIVAVYPTTLDVKVVGLDQAIVDSSLAAWMSTKRRAYWEKIAASAIKGEAEAVRQILVDSEGAKDREVGSWPNKAARAHRKVEGEETAEDEATLATEAALRGLGETSLQLAQYQIIKENLLASAISVIDGYERQYLDVIPATDLNDLLELGSQMRSAINAALGL